MSPPLDSPDYPSAEMVAGWHEFVADQILTMLPNDHWSTSIAVWFDRWQHQQAIMHRNLAEYTRRTFG